MLTTGAARGRAAGTRATALAVLFLDDRPARHPLDRGNWRC